MEEEEDTPSISEAYGSWILFRNSSRELWILLFMKFIESFAMTSEDLVFMLYLRKDEKLAFTESESGTLYMMTAALIFIYGVTIAGYLIDSAGVKTSLMLGSMCSALARLILGLA